MMWTSHRMRYDRITYKGKDTREEANREHRKKFLSVSGGQHVRIRGPLWSWVGGGSVRGLWTMRARGYSGGYSAYRCQLVTKCGVPLKEQRQLLKKFLEVI